MTPGQVAYEAFCEAVGPWTFSEMRLQVQPFHLLPKALKEAWEAAAAAARETK